VNELKNKAFNKQCKHVSQFQIFSLEGRKGRKKSGNVGKERKKSHSLTFRGSRLFTSLCVPHS
jgi:hypothetical protein